MPSIGEIANESKALLEDINTNTLGTRNNTQTIITELNQLETEVAQVNGTAQAGFTNLAQGLAVMLQMQAQNNELLAGNNKQNDTIICWLDQIAHVLCDIKHNTDAEVKIQKGIAATLSHLEHIEELVHAREAMEVMNRYSLEKRLEECCPTREPEPQPCFEDCKAPQLPEPNPIRTDWKPINFQQVIG